MKSLGWALIQHDWCPPKRRNLDTDRRAHRRWSEEPRGKYYVEIKLGSDPAVSQRYPETQPKARRRAWNTASPANTLTTDVWSPEPRDNKYLLFRLPCVWYFAWQPRAMKTLGYSRLVTMAALSSLHEEPPFRGNQSTPLPTPFTYSKRNSENVRT